MNYHSVDDDQYKLMANCVIDLQTQIYILLYVYIYIYTHIYI